MLVAIAGFIVPYMFVYNSYLLLQGDAFQIILGCVTGLLGVIGLASAVQGFLIDDLNIVERLLLLSIPFLILYPSLVANCVGVEFLVAVYLKQKAWMGRREGKAL